MYLSGMFQAFIPNIFRLKCFPLHINIHLSLSGQLQTDAIISVIFSSLATSPSNSRTPQPTVNFITAPIPGAQHADHTIIKRLLDLIYCWRPCLQRLRCLTNLHLIPSRRSVPSTTPTNTNPQNLLRSVPAPAWNPDYATVDYVTVDSPVIMVNNYTRYDTLPIQLSARWRIDHLFQLTF